MRKLLALGLLLTIPFVLFAQDGQPVAVLEYFDNPDGVFVYDGDGEELFPEYGMELMPGDKVKTTTSIAELRLDPNQSLIKLATKTEFVVDTLQNRGGAGRLPDQLPHATIPIFHVECARAVHEVTLPSRRLHGFGFGRHFRTPSR